MRIARSAALGAMLLCAGALHSAQLGDSAPELKIANWVKGEPVKVRWDGVYVVEFWATWCGPCKQSIPHLTEMQKKYKQVAFVGISDEKVPLVSSFVKDMGDKMDYRVAIDDDHATSKGYMGAFEVNGIPHAFVVKGQKIIWHGHPMDHLDETLQEITSGTYDLEKAKAKMLVQDLYEQFQEAALSGDDATADKLTGQITANSKDVKGIFENDKFDPALEKSRIKVMQLRSGFLRALVQGDSAKEKELGEKLKQADPSINLDELRGRAEMGKLLRQYINSVSSDSAAADLKSSEELGSRLADKLKGNPEIGNQVAWGILTSDDIKHRDLPLATRIARQACDDSKWKEPQLLDTYARALFESGKKEDAIETQKKAIALADGDDKTTLEETLKKYQR